MDDLEPLVALARDDFDSGNYKFAGLTLDVMIKRGGVALGEAALLRARLAIRQGEPLLAITVLGDARSSLSEAQLVEADLHLMLAHAFAGDHAAAEVFASALDEIDVPIPQSLIVEIIHARASMLWARGDLALVERELGRCKPHRDLRSQARHLQLTAAIAGRRENYARQCDILCEALEIIRADRKPEIPLQTTLLRSLCIGLREIVGAEHQVEYATELYRTIAWTPELSSDHVVCALHLAWIRALAGDQLGAMRYVQDGYNAAERSSWIVAALTDRSAIRTVTGEASSALLDLEQCLSLAEKIDWQNTTDEERLYLITLAELAGPINPPRAQALLLRSNILARGGNMRLAYHQNRRIQAMAHHASGVIAHAAGDTKLARASLKIAYDTFAELKCVSRAAETAIALHRVTGEESWLRAATEGARAYPRSWIAQATRSIASEEQDTAYSRLTPRQREVFKLLLEGLTVAKIAESIGSRPNTVRNHVQGVYHSFGVSSHIELVVEARRRRLA